MPSTNSKPSPFNALLSSPRLSFVDELTTLARELCDFSVPEGYEDETGFHFAPVRTASRLSIEDQNRPGEAQRSPRLWQALFFRPERKVVPGARIELATKGL
jgi:hypothetical protein